MEPVLVERSEGVVTVTINRPERKNAANAQVWRGLKDAFTEARERAEDRVVVVTGAGGEFCSGADLTDLSVSQSHPLTFMRAVADVALSLHRIPKPTIAKVRGIAAGAGCNVALSCDLIVAADDARFTQIFPKRGLSLDFGGSWLLPRLVGIHRAKELAFFGEIISGADAAEMGLVNRSMPAGELDAFVDEWARQLASGPPLALSMTKAQINSSFATSMEQALELEASLQAVNLRSADTAEAMRAFAEKRPPDFQGF